MISVMVDFLTSLSHLLDEPGICWRYSLEQCVELLELAYNLLTIFGQ
jgi:hypothetical protein